MISKLSLYPISLAYSDYLTDNLFVGYGWIVVEVSSLIKVDRYRPWCRAISVLAHSNSSRLAGLDPVLNPTQDYDMAAATSPSYESEAVALIEVRHKWRFEKTRIPAKKGRWHNKKVVYCNFEC